MIHNYSYKPEAEIGYKNDRESREHLTFGVELECEPRNDGGAIRMDAHDLSDLIDAVPGNRVYCKSDGSLTRGVEIVSHPGTLAHHMYVMHWRQIQRTAEKAGFRSHDAANSGLHVHVGRQQLGRTDVERNDVVRKLQILFALYENELTRFSRRTRSRLNEWAPFDHFNVPSDAIRSASADRLQSWAETRVPTYSSNHNERYHAINVTNTATVEIRIFRGTLKRDTLIAAVQLVSNLCKYAMQHSWAEIQRSTWADVATCEPHKELIDYLAARGLIAAGDMPSALPAGNRASDFYGVDGIARRA